MVYSQPDRALERQDLESTGMVCDGNQRENTGLYEIMYPKQFIFTTDPFSMQAACVSILERSVRKLLFFKCTKHVDKIRVAN